MIFRLVLVCLLCRAVLADHARADDFEKPAEISTGKIDPNGIRIHDVRSHFQADVTQIRLLLPEIQNNNHPRRVIYVLPVEAGNEDQYGDGLLEVLRQKLPQKYDAIFVSPTFTHLPWYADHPTNSRIRQETYFLKVVLPFIEQQYQTKPDANHRLLLGFSKSGWGAYSLLLRHPDTFGRAVAWDAPLMLDQPGDFGSSPIFGDAENFAKYRITRLLELRADEFRKEARLILLGYGNFQDHHARVHQIMSNLSIRHEFRDGPSRTHDWHSGWVSEAVELLLSR